MAMSGREEMRGNQNPSGKGKRSNFARSINYEVSEDTKERDEIGKFSRWRDSFAFFFQLWRIVHFR